MNQRRASLGVPTCYRPSRYLGADATESALKTAAPYIKALVADSATEDVETLRAMVRNHKAIRNSFRQGTAMWVLYDNKVRVLEARLRAALAAQEEEHEDRQSKWEFAAIGKTLGVGGIIASGALILLLLNAAGAAHRSHR